MLSGRGGLARVRMALLIIPAIVVEFNMAGDEKILQLLNQYLVIMG